MTKIDEDKEQRECFHLCEVDIKVMASRPMRSRIYQYLALCVYSCCCVIVSVREWC
jgi:hypothetical protein